MTAVARPENWAGNVAFGAVSVAAPADVDGLCRALEGVERAKAVGAGHSFSAIADTDGVLVSTAGLTSIGPIDADRQIVTIESGVRYADLCPWLHERGWALHNLPSLPHVTVAGAVATGTHGSGSASGGLATSVVAVELVTADGELRRIESGDPGFEGAVVSIGALGILARLDLSIEPAYDMEQRVWSGLAWRDVLDDFDLVVDAASSVSLFTRWTGEWVDQAWTKQRVGADPGAALTPLGARPFDVPVHPVGGDASTCTTQLGRPGPWHERLTHFRDGFRPGTGAELQSEFFVDRRVAVEALSALRGVGPALDPILLASEVRTIAADELWLSPAHGCETVALHFTWTLDPAAVAPVLAELERALEPFEPRPHWGKLTGLDAATIRSRFPRIDAFDELRAELDPHGVFDNAALRSLLGTHSTRP